MVGHVTPEAFDGGPIALVEEGDIVVIDLQNKKLDVVSASFTLLLLNLDCFLQLVDNTVLTARRAQWKPPSMPVTGLLKKYRSLVSSAHYGATTY